MNYISISNLSLPKIKSLLKTFPNIELRLDLLELTLPEFEEILKISNNLIVTFRKNSKTDDTDRLKFFLKALKYEVKYIDLEIEESDSFIKTIKEASKSTKLIISYHNFTKTDKLADLQKKIEKSFKLGADLAKVACLSKNMKDNAKLLTLYSYVYEKYSKKEIVAIGMGSFGKITRLAANYLGAPINYLSLKEQKTAPGQFNQTDYNKIMEILNND